MHFVAERMSRSALVGVFTAPIAMGISAFAALSLPDTMQGSEPLVPALKSNWLMMHVSVMLLSYATLLVGALIAIAFLIVTRGQEVELKGSFHWYRRLFALLKLTRSLKSRMTSQGANLPWLPSPWATAALRSYSAKPLPPQSRTCLPQRLTLADTLDNISYRMIGLGFPLLTIGIIAGAVWANEAWGSYWSWDPKETWALITWLVFAAYLHARITKGVAGAQTCYSRCHRLCCGLGVLSGGQPAGERSPQLWLVLLSGGIAPLPQGCNNSFLIFTESSR